MTSKDITVWSYYEKKSLTLKIWNFLCWLPFSYLNVDLLFESFSQQEDSSSDATTASHQENLYDWGHSWEKDSDLISNCLVSKIHLIHYFHYLACCRMDQDRKSRYVKVKRAEVNLKMIVEKIAQYLSAPCLAVHYARCHFNSHYNILKRKRDHGCCEEWGRGGGGIVAV